MGTGAQAYSLTVLILPFLGALAAPGLVSMFRHNAAWIVAIIPAAAFIHFASMLPSVAAGAVIAGGHDWIPSLGVRLAWRIDGLSLAFALLISGIGTFILIYAGAYLKGHKQHGRFLAFLLLFMGAMQGLVLSDSFMMLFFFWELTSISSFLLIGFDHARQEARRAALQALIVTGMGGLSLLGGLALIWSVTGTSEMSALLLTGEMMRQSPLYLFALILVLGGAFTKSAQFPLHFWLPNAMAAPTPVSAYLHSATMVKAGVYLLMRLNPVLGGTHAWETVLPLFGAVTLVVGAGLALRQTDLKLMLAQTTVASLGLLVMLTGHGTEAAIEAAVLYLVAHALFKGALFMVAGGIDHQAGSRDLARLGGLRQAMPVTFAIALVAALSMGGLPPFAGFLAKEQIYAALTEPAAAALLAAAIAGNALMFAAAFAVALKPFLGQPRAQAADDGPAMLWLGPLVLAVAGLLLALSPDFYHAALSGPMASAVAGTRLMPEVTALPHAGLPLALSAATVALGIALFLGLDRVRAAVAALLAAIGWGPDRGFDQAMRGLIRLSFALSGVLHGGALKRYMSVVLVFIALAILAPMLLFDGLPALPPLPPLNFYEATVMALAVIGAVAVVLARDRLTAMVTLGIQGFAVAMLYMLFGAPDLSFTQFMVETLSVVILALVMTRLRLDLPDVRAPLTRLADIAIAGACGAAFVLVMLKAVEHPFDATLTEYFNAYSRAIAHGRNIVNVIIVDFRGLDTMGEITVVLIAGLAILSLLRISSGRTRTHGAAAAQPQPAAKEPA